MDYDHAIAAVNKYKEYLSPENDIKKIFHALQKLNKVGMTINILHTTGVGKSVNKLKKMPGIGDFAKQLVMKWKALLVSQNEPNEKTNCETKSASEEQYDPAGNWEMKRQDDGAELQEEYDPTQNWKMQKKKSRDKKVFNNNPSSYDLKYDSSALNKSTTSEESDRHVVKSRKKPSKRSAAQTYNDSCSDDGYPSSESNVDNSRQFETLDSEDECLSPDSTTYVPSVQSQTVYSTSYDDTDRGRDSAVPAKSKHFNNRNSDHRKSGAINVKKEYVPSGKLNKKDSAKTNHVKERIKTLPAVSADRKMEATTSTGKRKRETTEYGYSPKKINKVKTADVLSPTKKINKEKMKSSKVVKVNSSKSSFKDTQTNGETRPKKRNTTSKKAVAKKASGDFSFEDFMMMDTSKVMKKKKVLKDYPSLSADNQVPKTTATVKPKVELHLPKIQQTYRPLPNALTQSSSLPSKPSRMTDAMAAELHTQRSSNKMVVYSGHKKSTLTEVLSLYDQCMAVLKNNIDRLDFIGVPYDIIKPVLERCTVEQLYRLEDCNSYLLEDTDELWMKHAMVDFRSHQPDDMEAWREMYLRLHDEREQKLTRLTHSIQAKVNKAKPLEKRTKLAYVGIGEAKAPRNVLRAQLKYGTAGQKPIPYQKSSSSSSSQGSSSDSLRHQVTDVRMSVPVGSITAASVDNVHPSRSMRRQPPRVAPMMAKTLKSFKLRYKR